MQPRLSKKRSIGLSLLGAGILLIYLFLSIAISLGLFVVLFYVWLVSLLIYTGLSILLEFGLKTYAKALLGGSGMILLIGAIFATPISFDLKLLLVNVLLATLALLSQYSLRRKPSKHRGR